MKQYKKKKERIIPVTPKGKAKKELHNHHWKSVIYPLNELPCTFLIVFSCHSLTTKGVRFLFLYLS